MEMLREHLVRHQLIQIHLDRMLCFKLWPVPQELIEFMANFHLLIWLVMREGLTHHLQTDKQVGLVFSIVSAPCLYLVLLW